ncbi:MAG: large-conductance mechanosensitive channel protein MscL [Paludibacteraceae bacterium]|nr:large-conductance mechanosensitive channel protein MscL [Paludibacteraceae bacterium]
MSLISDFKDFAMKGNVVDMAIGVIIGGAFGKIVTSMVSDIMMPILGYVIGGVNFTDFKLTLKEAVPATDTTPAVEAVTLNYGNFLQVTFDFLIVAICIFAAIRLVSNFTKKKEEAPAPAPEPPAPSKEEVLLTEIRDLLKNK